MTNLSDFAVIEMDGKEMRDIPKNNILATAKVSDVLKLVSGKYEVDFEETKRRRAEVEQMMNDLWK